MSSESLHAYCKVVQLWFLYYKSHYCREGSEMGNTDAQSPDLASTDRNTLGKLGLFSVTRAAMYREDIEG